MSTLPLRQAFWRLVHKMPCAVVHRLCSLCREEDMCPRCWEQKTTGLPWQTITGPPLWTKADRPMTFTTGTTSAYRWAGRP